jgi:hypothetical protein
VLDVQRHFPAIGSQKGVEQFVGTTQRKTSINVFEEGERRLSHGGSVLAGHPGSAEVGSGSEASALSVGNHTIISSASRFHITEKQREYARR